MQIGNNQWIGRVTKYTDLLLRWVSVTVGAFAKADPANFPAAIAPYITTLQKGWILPFVLIATPIAFWARNKTDRSKLAAVHGLLDQVCDHTFKNDKFDHEQNRRVTLFKYHKFTWRRWPFFGGWLIPIERSGESTRNTNAIFRAPDDGEKCEGVAGRAWSKRSNVYVSNLPNLRNSPTDIQYKEYAEQSFVSVDKLRRKPPQACSLLGIPIEVGQRRWGVIVVDSVLPQIPQKATKTCLKQIVPTLSSYLRGV